MELFKIENLTFSYPENEKKVLSDISISIKEGDIVLIAGRSGCGKTTLLNHLKSSMTPAGSCSGSISYKSIALADVDFKTQSKEIGYVLQNPSDQTVTDKVWHELCFGAENIGMDPDDIARRIAETSNFFDIGEWYDRDVNDLSGGQKQLVNLAAVMVLGPDVLILDEPTAQLDPVSANEFLNAIYRINNELGTTIIMTEHRLESVFSHADQLVYLEDGKVVYDGSPSVFYPEMKSRGRLTTSNCFYFLPTVMQVYYSLEESGTAPSSVRDGRAWLTEYATDKGILGLTYHREYARPYAETILELKDIFFRYEKNGKDILKALNLKLEKGSIFSVIGGNGRGKSTLLKLISGHITAYSGKIIHEKSCKISVLPQECTLMFSHDSVREELSGMSSNQEKIDEAVELFELNGLLDRHPFDISMGQQKCLGLAMLYLSECDILLLDEVTGGLDPVFKEKFGYYFQEMKKSGKSIVSVSHDIEFCSRFSDYVGMLFNGDLIGTDRPNRFFFSNTFYTTLGARLSKGIFNDTVNSEDIINICKKQQDQ